MIVFYSDRQSTFTGGPAPTDSCAGRGPAGSPGTIAAQTATLQTLAARVSAYVVVGGILLSRWNEGAVLAHGLHHTMYARVNNKPPTNLSRRSGRSWRTVAAAPVAVAAPVAAASSWSPARCWPPASTCRCRSCWPSRCPQSCPRLSTCPRPLTTESRLVGLHLSSNRNTNAI